MLRHLGRAISHKPMILCGAPGLPDVQTSMLRDPGTRDCRRLWIRKHRVPVMLPAQYCSILSPACLSRGSFSREDALRKTGVDSVLAADRAVRSKSFYIMTYNIN